MVVAVKDEEIDNMNEIIQSEQKRLKSLRDKKQQFRFKEQLIRDALSNLDKKVATKKIIFDDDFGEDLKDEKQTKAKRKRKALFDNEEDEEDDSTEFEININKSQKEVKLQQPLGHDNRFKLDSRFLEDEDNKVDETEVPEAEGDISNLEQEKKWQLDLLGNILGAPISMKEKKDPQLSKKAKMIRYDPTANNHEEYEVKVEKPEPLEKKKKKKEVKKNEVEEAPPVEVSKEIFYSVSDTLKESVTKAEEFSLLKTYGKVKEDESAINDTENSVPVQKPKFQLNFDSTNPFKYDSTDDENEEDNSGKSEAKDNLVDAPAASNLFAKNDNLFFDTNDARFNEGIKFFKEESVASSDFKVLRRELKQIVRAKIRNNVRKGKPGKVKRLMSNKKNKIKRR